MARVIARGVLSFGLVSIHVDILNTNPFTCTGAQKMRIARAKSAGLSGVVERDDLVCEPRPITHSPNNDGQKLRAAL